MPVICSTKAVHIVYVDRFPPIGLHILCQSGSPGRRGRESQREGMGLLEYQAMPSLRDVAHDGWLCTFTMQQQLEIPSARSCWAAPVRATGTVRKRQAVWPGQNDICPVTLLHPARRAAVLGQPSSLWPHWGGHC